MTTDKSIEVLKQAILLEKQGKAFYLMIAAQATDNGVREFFEGMSDEESRHIQALSEQYKAYKKDGRFIPLGDVGTGNIPELFEILSKEVKRRLSAASVEAAAIAAAVLMEENATKLYADRAEKAVDPEEKALYKWLSEWERDHVKALLALERELRESVWHDNSFWPM